MWFSITWNIIFLIEIFWQESQNGCNGLFYLLIKYNQRNQNEVVIERVFADPQGEKTSGERCWVRTQVMQEASSPKSSQDSLWSAKEQEAHKWISSRKNTI